MKKLLLFLICCQSAFAGDLIYKQGFEATALVSGTASNINSAGLTLNLDVGGSHEVLAINNQGSFSFFSNVAVGASYTVSLKSLPNSPQQNCVLSNAVGIMSTTGSDTLIVTCDNNAWNWGEMKWDEGGWN